MSAPGKAYHPEQAKAFDAETEKMSNEQKTVDRLLKIALSNKLVLQKFRQNGGAEATAS